MPDAPPPIITQEIRIVDPAGEPRLILSAASGTPSVVLLGNDATPKARLALDADGRPSLVLSNPDGNGPVAAIEIDDKGAHVKFDRPGGASSYLFLNTGGGSGLVLIDGTGKRRVSVVVGPDGHVAVQGFEGSDPLPQP